MNEEPGKLDNAALIERTFEALHLIILHYGTWFWETEHQIGLDKAIAADDIAWKQILLIILNRVTRRLGLPAKDSIPALLTQATREELAGLVTDMALNWLANDGIWFQAVEKNFDYEMYNAKRINDSSLGKFSYIEAKRIVKRRGLPERGGLPALKEALRHRQYALINKQEIIDAGDNKIIFRMNECRVHLARNRANLPEYPCKSAGVTEYTSFAEAIDPRIKTACIACPPDPHPAEWYCAWEFTL